MTFPAINSPIADHLISALCNTLVHSLWQGLLLAAIAGLIIIFTKRASSALRYNLLISALLLFAVGTVITFVVQFQHGYDAGAGPLVNAVQPNTSIVQTYHGPLITQPGNFGAILSGYLNTYHNTIVLIWFLIICAKSIQLGVGLFGTYQLKRVNVIAAGSYWEERMKQLACLLGIRQTISLLESGIAKVPMVIGHLKPVILIPIGLLTALSAEEVEAILVHELAHIKRRDYLVNMLQSLMEILFFFNPAVLWISQLIKTERENCCDDMVVEQSSNKISYIRALVSCEEYQAAVPAYAMAFPGSKNSLMDRVKRLASNRNHSLNLFEKTTLAVCLVVSGLCMSAFAERDNIKHTVKEVVKLFEHDTLNKDQQQKLAEQTNLLEQRTALLRQNTALLIANKPRLEIIDDTIRPKGHRVVNVHLDPINITMPQVNVHLDPTNIPTTSVNVHLDPVTVAVPQINVHLDPLNVSVPKVDIHLDPLNVSLTNVDVHLDPLNISLGKIDTNKKVKVKVRTNVSASSTMPKHPLLNSTPDISEELFKAHLITDKNNYKVQLNNNELIINGVKQSEENHQLILKKYMNKPGDKVNMNLSFSSTVTKN